MVPTLSALWANPQTWPLAFLAVSLSSILLVVIHLLINRPDFPSTAPTYLKGYPILGSLGFFGKRLDFLKRGQTLSPNRLFSFYYGRHAIVALSGTEGRSLFYTTRSLDLNAGFMMLFAARPNIDHIRHNPNDNIQPMFKRMLMRDRLALNLHYLTGDTHNALRAFDVNRPVDPFAVMYRLIYQLTHRTLGCHDVAEQPELLDSTLRHYSCIEESSPIQILFPELPTLAKIRKQWAGLNLYWQFRKIIHNRRNQEIKGTDAMQMLMDDGMNEIEIASFIIGALFAGLINSGINAAWILCYLTKNQEWYRLARDEIDGLVASHRLHPSESPEDILPRITIDEWETKLPIVDICLRESLRLNVSGTAMRRNIGGKDIKIPGTNQIIPAGAFAVYPVDEAHLDPAVFTDPYSYDPSRFMPDRAEDQKSPQSFLAFGGGLHPCLGMRFAKLSIFISTAYFMSYFDFYHCDEKTGVPLDEPLPTVDRNAIGMRLPTSIFLQCRRRF